MAKQFSYMTKFCLELPIVGDENIIAAKEYLEEKMETYLQSNIDFHHDRGDTTLLPGDIDMIRWELYDDGQEGRIHLVTNRELDSKELAFISDWVRGQNSDGLGEGFEQQEFATYVPCIEGYCDEVGDPDDCPDGIYNCPCAEMCSFDWQRNDYIFQKC